MVIKTRKTKEQDAIPGDPAFDRWVSRQLHKAYDEVLAEDVPAELLELVERWGEDDTQSSSKTPPDPSGRRMRRP